MESVQQVRNALIVDSVERQAADTPQAVAAIENFRRLTYEELDARANQLAHLLIERGVGKEALVAICMRRSLEFIVAALGILKAGAAYLPLDPDYPAQRLSMLLNDSATRLVLANQSSARQVPSGGWDLVVVDEVGSVAARYPRSKPDTNTGSQDLAYVIYTSGSTGRPKGVEITHSNLANLVQWHQRAFSISRSDRATFQASPGFDAAVWEIWPYLAAGACVQIMDDQTRTAPQALRDWMVQNRITISFLPTALAEPMLDLAWPKETMLRVLLTGADTLHRRPPSGLPFEFVNNYGPTECTVVSTSGVVPPGSQEADRPTIGTPLDNVQVYVVDEQMQRVPAGTPGELLIGGAGVGRGYLHLPELTAQKFIADGFGDIPNSRLYRTGDLVRQLPSGELAFLGRIDDQIKIRGYRIEPAEITASLNNHPSVNASIVVAQSDASGEQRLVAYIMATPGSHPQAGELRQALAEKLPDYMIPSLFVQVDRLPLSANGKVDRSALPLPTDENTLREDLYTAPESEMQERVATIVAKLLNVARVGIDDNFFYRGGHSLLGAQLIARISDIFGVELSLLSVFEDPTVRGISAGIERLFLERLESMSEDEAQRLLATPDGD